MPYFCFPICPTPTSISDSPTLSLSPGRSIYAEIPHIVAAVKSAKDVTFARNESGLPFYDVLLVTDLPKHASLPVSTVQQTKKRIQVGVKTSSLLIASSTTHRFLNLYSPSLHDSPLPPAVRSVGLRLCLLHRIGPDPAHARPRRPVRAHRHVPSTVSTK